MSLYFERKERDRLSNSHGTKSEKRVLKSIGVKRVPGSGSSPHCKSDGISTKYRFEAKATTHKSWSVKTDTLNKIADEARGFGQNPVVTLSFVDGSGNVVEGDYVIMRKIDFVEVNDLAYGEGGW